VRRILKLFLAVVFFLTIPAKGVPVNLSPDAEISILTCGPSDLIYAIYGHTAVRVKDPVRRLDVAFNYGVFSFNAPHFIYRFAKGQTDYMLVPERFSDFYEGYKRRGRSIYEQVLNLTLPEKQQVWDFLVENARPENREYRYNFFLDNCATRVRDVVKNQVGGTVVFNNEAGEGRTFREHVTDYQKVLPWTNFGIQLVVGSPADEVATAWQEMFLPDFLMKHFADARIEFAGKIRPLVKETHVLYESGQKSRSTFKLFSPVIIFPVLLIVVLFVSLHQIRKRKAGYWIDYLLLFFTGLIGWVLLWFVIYSEHPAMHPNYNLLWALPVNLVFAFAWMKKKWRPVLSWYWPALAAWLILFFLFSFLIPQAFHAGFYLIGLMVLCRAVLHTVVWLKENGRR